MKSNKTKYTSFEELPLILDVPTLAAVLDVGLSSAYALVRSGQIGFKVGKQYRIPRDQLRDFVTRHTSEMDKFTNS